MAAAAPPRHGLGWPAPSLQRGGPVPGVPETWDSASRTGESCPQGTFQKEALCRVPEFVGLASRRTEKKLLIKKKGGDRRNIHCAL